MRGDPAADHSTAYDLKDGPVALYLSDFAQCVGWGKEE
jgi:hypothetical protein